jgi:hypothetical protein
MKPQPAMLWNVGREFQIIYHDTRMDGMTLATPVYKTQAEGLETLEILRTTNLDYILQSQEVH